MMNFTVLPITAIRQAMSGAAMTGLFLNDLQENAANNSEPTVYVVLSVSNHAPYSRGFGKGEFFRKKSCGRNCRVSCKMMRSS